MGVIPFVEAQRVNMGAVEAVLEAGKAVVPPGPGQPDGGGGHPLLRRETAAAEQEALPLLRGVGGGRGGLGGGGASSGEGKEDGSAFGFFWPWVLSLQKRNANPGRM